MNIYAVSALINVLTSIVLGLLILLANKRSPVNRSFAAFTLSVAFWSYGYFMWQIATDAGTALFWTHMLMAGAIFITPVYFHFICYFLKVTTEKRFWIVSGYVFIALFTILNWTNLFITHVEPRAGFSFWPSAGPLFFPFLVVWFWYALYPILLLTKTLRSGSDFIQTSAIRYILAGTIIGYVGGATNYFLWYGISVLPFGNVSASIYLSLVAYAIMRHRLFNMKMIATELLIFSLWLFIFIRMLVANSLQDQLTEAGLLVIMLFAGTMLIRSVNREVEQRELIQKQERELEVVNKQQEGLLHFISHEIKGYLTKNEAGFSAIASGDYGVVPVPLKHMSEEALADTRKGVDTVMNILDASNLKKGTVKYTRKSFDFAKAADEVVSNLAPAAKEKNVLLNFHKPTGSFVVVGDEDKLRRHVIRNVIDNSIKYTNRGEITAELTRADPFLRLTVADTGVGITKEDMAHLFTEGGRGAESIKVNVHSTGYGLFIAKQIVEAHGGRIWAESEGKNKGSRFIVELPSAI